ncbi:MAG: hypothetical protein LVO36_04440 [Nitrosopumilus sp. (ex Thoosa mismalolli)]|nr:hypothetical protein [Nitrosopumilus sp. (ex Thoosa mismalolli)]
MSGVPLYIIGLPKDEPVNKILMSKIGGALEKFQKVFPNVIESKVSIKTQNSEGSRMSYDVTTTIKTGKSSIVYTDSGWDLLKIADEICRKLESELSAKENKRQRDSIRKKE